VVGTSGSGKSTFSREYGDLAEKSEGFPRIRLRHPREAKALLELLHRPERSAGST
jgi:hypothetical protein